MSQLRTGRSGVRIPRKKRVFFFSKPSSWNLEHHSSSCPVCIGFPFPGIKRQGREADQSPPSSAESNNVRSSISTPSICPRDVCRHFNIFVYRTRSEVTRIYLREYLSFWMNFDNIVLTNKFLPTAYFADNLPPQLLKQKLKCTKCKRPNFFSWKLNNADFRYGTKLTATAALYHKCSLLSRSLASKSSWTVLCIIIVRTL